MGASRRTDRQTDRKVDTYAAREKQGESRGRIIA